ncbi:MAG: hypothetical protein PWQ42_125 [Sulfurospirillum sp.]|jgi:hypothetical protein|nr:hypothetical protein [Sulfurospirillum sp.]
MRSLAKRFDFNVKDLMIALAIEMLFFTTAMFVAL